MSFPVPPNSARGPVTSDYLADEILDPSDPHVRESEAFPRLTADQVERVASFGVVQQLPRGTVLSRPGDRTIDFVVVLEGSIEAYVGCWPPNPISPMW
jgi:CRP-like cAMP-binding protein